MNEKETPQQKYDNEKMRTMGIKLKKELMDEFDEKIKNDPNETTRTQFIKRKIEEYLKEHK